MDNRTLIIEPFYGGSHKQLIDLLMDRAPSCVKYTLPAKKWHWKARTSALHFAQVVPRSKCYKVLFASSVLNLAELIALRADLAPLHKVLYFHENQLIYPVRKQQDRDFQYGYNQIISCLVADSVLFNSHYNMKSFLSSIDSFLGVIPVPEYRSKGVVEQIRPKCRVLHFPLELPNMDALSFDDIGGCRLNPLHVNDLKIAEKFTGTSDLRKDESERSFSNGHSDGDSLMHNDVLNHAGTGRDEFATHTLSSESDGGGFHHSSAASAHSQIKVGAGEIADLIRHKDTREETAIQYDSSHVTSGDKCLIQQSGTEESLHILWAHRWEHDKDPDLFFNTVMKLHEMGLDFRLSVLGEQFSDVPDIFAEANSKLKGHIVNWGYLPSKREYYKALASADVAVSTANHEFFGVAMLEAVHCGCYPLCPKRLVYPEIFPRDYLYSTPQQMFKRLREFCRHPHLIRKHSLTVDVKQFSWEELRSDYLSVLAPSSIVNQSRGRGRNGSGEMTEMSNSSEADNSLLLPSSVIS